MGNGTREHEDRRGWEEAGNVMPSNRLPNAFSPAEVRRAIARLNLNSTDYDARVTVIEAWPAADITAVQIANWDTAFGWGDHSAAGYLKADGTVALTGNLAVDALITIDGRDISVDGAALDILIAIAAKVAVDSGATPGFLGAAFNDGVLRTGTGISYADGGDFVTLALSHLGIESLADPAVDRILFWDNSGVTSAWLTPSTGLQIVGVNLTTKDSEIVHNNTSGYVANRHYDHTAITFSAGDGLSGGGTIAGDRSFALDINGLDADTITGADTIVFYDDTGAHNNKISFTSFSAAIDHGALLGRGDDDHSLYHTDGRAATWLAAGHETTYNHANYDLAYGWGDHAGGGYLKANGTVPLTGAWTTGAFNIIGSGHWYVRSNTKMLYFGAANNALIRYNGTTLVINSRSVGTGGIKLYGAVDTDIFSLNVGGTITSGAINASDSIQAIAATGSYITFSCTRYGAHSFAPLFLSRKSRGTSSVPVGINGGDNLLRHAVNGMLNTGAWAGLSSHSDAIVINAAGAWTAANNGRDLNFLVCTQGTVVAITALTMTDAANVWLPANSRELQFGATPDARIYYDATDLVIDPKLAGAGAVKIIGDMYFSVAGSGLPRASIYAYNAGDTITISGTGIANKEQITTFDTNDVSNLATPDHANDHITIDKAGDYLVLVSISISSTGGTAYKMDFGVFKNGGTVQFQGLNSHRNLSGGGGDDGSVSISDVVTFAATDTVEVWCWNETNTNNIVIDDITLTVVQVGG